MLCFESDDARSAEQRCLQGPCQKRTQHGQQDGENSQGAHHDAGNCTARQSAAAAAAVGMRLPLRSERATRELSFRTKGLHSRWELERLHTAISE